MKKAALVIVLTLFLAACTTPVEDTDVTPTPVDAASETEPQTATPPMVGQPVGTVADDEQPADEPTAPTSASGITRAELATHDSKSDCWVGYQGTVYDLTAWLLQHPGGADAIAPYCGTVEEFTAAYTAQHKRKDSTRIANRGDEQGAFVG